MSGSWARLVHLQKEVYEETLNQYRFGNRLQDCATTAGLKPRAMVTLYSDVLGRELFLALGRDQAQAGGSAQDRQKFIETTVNLLNKGGRVSKHVGVLFEKNKSRGERVSEGFSSVVNELGGPAMFAFGAASLTGNIWAGFKELRKTMTASDKQKLDAVVRQHVVNQEFQGKQPEEVIRLLAVKYDELKRERETLLKFLKTTEKDPTNSDTDKKDLQDIASALSGMALSDSEDLPKALIAWLATSLRSVKSLMGSSSNTWNKPQLGQDQSKIQEIVDKVTRGCVDQKISDDESKELQAVFANVQNQPDDQAKIEKLKELLNTNTEKVSLGLLTAFMRESYTLRYVLQELLKQQSQSR
jgi:hypothetical protein